MGGGLLIAEQETLSVLFCIILNVLFDTVDDLIDIVGCDGGSGKNQITQYENVVDYGNFIEIHVQ